MKDASVEASGGASRRENKHQHQWVTGLYAFNSISTCADDIRLLSVVGCNYAEDRQMHREIHS